MKAPFLRSSEIRTYAAEFLKRFHNTRTVPVPIEEIIEFMLGIDIIPMPGLQRTFDVEAFISADKTEIRVDDYVYSNRQQRYRFSLAHEIGHWAMHGDLWAVLTFSSVDEWKDTVQRLPPKEYGFVEWQAHEFAGLILVPPEELLDAVNDEISKLNVNGHSVDEFEPETLIAYISNPIARRFDVSTIVVEKRIAADKII